MVMKNTSTEAKAREKEATARVVDPEKAREKDCLVTAEVGANEILADHSPVDSCPEPAFSMEWEEVGL